MNRNQFYSLLVASMVLMSGMGAASAAVSWDTETTDTSTKSDVTGSTSSISIVFGDSASNFTVETDGAGTSDLSLELQHYDEDISETYYNTTDFTATNSTAGHYETVVTGANISEMPRGPTGVTVDVVVKNDSGSIILEQEDVKIDTSGNGERESLVYVTSHANSSDYAFESDSLSVSTEEVGVVGKILGESGTQIATVEDSYNHDSNVTQVYSLSNSNSSAAFDAASEDVEDSDWIVGTQAIVGTHTLKVYDSGSNINVSSGTPYVVHDESTDTLTVHQNGADLPSDVSVKFVGGEAYGFGTASSAFGVIDAVKTLAA